MKAISAELEAAQKGLGAVPYVGSLRVGDRLGDVPRLRWALFYSDSAISKEHYHACVIASSGYLVRVRVGDDGLGTQTIWCQSCPVPGNSSTWPAWSVLATNTVGGPPALVEGENGTLYLFWISVTGMAVRMATSSDNGLTWSANSAVVSHTSGQIKAVAAAFRPGDGTIGLFWGWDSGLGGADADIYHAFRYRSGTWSGKTAWGLAPVHSITGLSAHYRQDWNLVFSGRGPADSGSGVTVYHQGVWAVQLGDGGDRPAGNWGRNWIRRAFSGAGFQYYGPSLHLASQCYRLSHVEVYRGRDAFTRLHLSYRSPEGFEGRGWLDPVPFDYDGATGATLVEEPDGGQVYLIGPGKGWTAAVGGEVDLTSRLLRYAAEQRPLEGKLSVDLDNSDGALAGAGVQHPYGPLRRGGEVRLSRGYVLPGGDRQAVEMPSFWIDQMEYLRTGEGSTLRLHCLGGWDLLRAVKVERPTPYPGDSIATILEALAALAGLKVVWEGTPSTESARVPPWALKPGEPVLEGFNELLARIPEAVRLGGDGLVFRVLSDMDPIAYQFGGSGHPIRRSALRLATPESNHVQVYGKLVTVAGGTPAVQTLFGEAVDFDEAELVYHRLAKLFDPLAAGDDAAAGRAATALAGFLGQASSGSLVVSPVVNLEMWDMVGVTEPMSGLESSKRRVVRLKEEYDAGRARYEQEIGFGGEAGKASGLLG